MKVECDKCLVILDDREELIQGCLPMFPSVYETVSYKQSFKKFKYEMSNLISYNHDKYAIYIIYFFVIHKGE